MKRLIPILLLLVSGVANAEQWLCIPDAKAGFKYVNSEWEAGSFMVPNKYVIAHHMGTDWATMLSDQEKYRDCGDDDSCPKVLRWGVKVFGDEKDTYSCGTPNILTVLRCQETSFWGFESTWNTFMFNRTTLLFQITKLHGFLEGITDFTPTIEIGKCSPF